jgi:tetratricopeptide (TPR) repeat protein
MSSPRTSRKKIIICLCLALITGAVFGTAVSYDFVNYDDPHYVTDNRLVQSGLSVRGVIGAFTTTLQKHWHPLTLLSHMLDYQLFGLNPAGHHITSILLHIVNTVLLFLLLTRMTKALWPSAFVAALFAIHPLHIESVVWIAARKDVLSTFFMLMSLWVYVSYTERAGLGRYLLTLGLFAAGLLSKSIVVTLPFIMILLDFWPLRRLRVASSGENGLDMLSPLLKSRVFWEKVPFFSLSIIIGTLTLWAFQAISTTTTGSLLPFSERLPDRFVGAMNGYASYIWKMFWPANLSIGYQDNVSTPNWQSVLSFAVIIVTSSLCLTNIKKRPYLLVGWLWFIGMLAPISGIFRTGPILSADRYTYASFIGLFVMLSWGILDESSKRFQGERVGIIAICLFLVMCSVLSLKQIRYWKDSLTLFSHAVVVSPNDFRAHLHLGLALHKAGNGQKAMEHLNRTFQLSPGNAEVHHAIGYVLFERKEYREAIGHFLEAIRIKPNYASAHMQLAICFAQTGSFEKARDHFLEAIRIDPDDPNTHYNFGYALIQQKEYREAFEQMKKASEIDPSYSKYYDAQRGIKLYEDGKLQEARELLESVVRHIPEKSEVYLYLGLIASSMGQPDSAVSFLLESIRANPRYVEAHVNLGIELAKKKEYALAEEAFSNALTIEPNHVMAHYNYAVLFYLQDRRKEAMEQLLKILEIDPDYKNARDMLDALQRIKIE